MVTYHRRVDRPASLKGQFGLKGRRWVDRLAGDLAGAVAGRGEKPGGTEQGRGSREVDGDAGIVEMHAGGWSFAARDMAGRVWVWGEYKSFHWFRRWYSRISPLRLLGDCLCQAFHRYPADIQDNWTAVFPPGVLHHGRTSMSVSLNRPRSLYLAKRRL